MAQYLHVLDPEISIEVNDCRWPMCRWPAPCAPQWRRSALSAERNRGREMGNEVILVGNLENHVKISENDGIDSDS